MEYVITKEDRQILRELAKNSLNFIIKRRTRKELRNGISIMR